MRKMTTCLWFDHGKAREAAEFYASVFPDSRVERGLNSPSGYPDGKADNIEKGKRFPFKKNAQRSIERRCHHKK